MKMQTQSYWNKRPKSVGVEKKNAQFSMNSFFPMKDVTMI